MPKVAVISAQKLIKVLKKSGFIFDHIRGSHHILYHPQKKIVISVPVHKGRDLGRGITLSILKDAKISLKDLKK